MQNHGLMFFIWLSRLASSDNLSMVKDAPSILRLSSFASSVFLIGRDSNNDPVLGIPDEFMPWFPQLDWLDASICRNEGYLYLEVRDPKTQHLHVAIGIHIRSQRLNVIHVPESEDISKKTLSMRVFFRDKNDPSSPVIFQNEPVLVGIALKEIERATDIPHDMSGPQIDKFWSKTGLQTNFSPVKLAGLDE